MIFHILRIFVTRLGASVLSFLLVILSARWLGADGRGIISLIILNITVCGLVHQIFGGNSLIYFTKKIKSTQLILVSYVWALICCVTINSIFYFANIIPDQYIFLTFLLSMAQCFFVTNNSILMGTEKVAKQNMLNLFQILLHLLFFIFAFQLLRISGVSAFIGAALCANMMVWIWSFFFLRNEKNASLNTLKIAELIKVVWQYGKVIQSTNLIQFLNYRFTYYLIELYCGTAMLGIYSTAMSIAESVWIFTRSLSNILYPKIVNAIDQVEIRNTTLLFLKASFSITLLGTLGLICMPAGFYSLIFGDQFIQIKDIILFSAPGLVFMGVVNIIAHYFSGISKVHINLKSAIIGIFCTFIIGAFLIKNHCYYGAIATTNIAYGSIFLFLFYCFVKDLKLQLSDLKISARDLRSLWGRINNSTQ